jgi:hypothetical protein
VAPKPPTSLQPQPSAAPPAAGAQQDDIYALPNVIHRENDRVLYTPQQVKDLRTRADPTYNDDRAKLTAARARILANKGISDKQRTKEVAVVNHLIAEREKQNTGLQKDVTASITANAAEQRGRDSEEKAQLREARQNSDQQGKAIDDMETQFKARAGDSDKTYSTLTPLAFNDTKEKRAEMANTARVVAQYNPTLDGKTAADVVLRMTTAVPPKEAADPKYGGNGKVGPKGAYFKPIGKDVDGHAVVEVQSTTGGTHRIRIPMGTYNDIQKLHQRTNAHIAKTAKEAADKKTADEKQGISVGKVVSAFRPDVPSKPPTAEEQAAEQARLRSGVPIAPLVKEAIKPVDVESLRPQASPYYRPSAP